MFKDFTYKKKNRLLWLTASIFVLVFYVAAMRNTVNAYVGCREGEKKLSEVKQLEQRSASMKAQLGKFKKLIGSRQKQESNAQQQLMGIITGYCQKNGLILREYPPAITMHENDLDVVTNTFVLEGDFINLLKLVYLLEQKEKAGRMASVKFYTKKDYKTNTNSLLTALYIQNINTHEEKS